MARRLSAEDVLLLRDVCRVIVKARRQVRLAVIARRLKVPLSRVAWVTYGIRDCGIFGRSMPALWKRGTARTGRPAPAAPNAGSPAPSASRRRRRRSGKRGSRRRGWSPSGGRGAGAAGAAA